MTIIFKLQIVCSNCSRYDNCKPSITTVIHMDELYTYFLLLVHGREDESLIQKMVRNGEIKAKVLLCPNERHAHRGEG